MGAPVRPAPALGPAGLAVPPPLSETHQQGSRPPPAPTRHSSVGYTAPPSGSGPAGGAPPEPPPLPEQPLLGGAQGGRGPGSTPASFHSQPLSPKSSDRGWTGRRVDPATAPAPPRPPASSRAPAG